MRAKLPSNVSGYYPLHFGTEKSFYNKIFQPLLFYYRPPSLSGVNGFLLALYINGAFSAVFGAVGFRLKRYATDRTPPCGIIPENLRFQRFPLFIF